MANVLGVVPFSQVKLNARRYSDMENSSFVSDAELTIYCQTSHQELYDILLTTYGPDYFVASPSLITTDGVSDTFSLPADFYKLLGVDLQVSGTAGAPTGYYIPLRPFNWSERIRYSVPYVAAVYPGVAYPRYRLRGNLLWMVPLPKASQTLRMWYAPRLQVATSDTDSVDGISGWEDYISVDAAIKMKQKEDSDASLLEMMKKSLLDRIQMMAENRDENGPLVTADTRNRDAYSYPGWGWSGGDGDFY